MFSGQQTASLQVILQTPSNIKILFWAEPWVSVETDLGYLYWYFRAQGAALDVSRPGRKIVSKGILVIQNLTRHDAGEQNYLCWLQIYTTTNMVVSNIFQIAVSSTIITTFCWTFSKSFSIWKCWIYQHIYSSNFLYFFSLIKEFANTVEGCNSWWEAFEASFLYVLLLSGDYACVAENDNGAGESSPLEIQVLCKLSIIISTH